MAINEYTLRLFLIKNRTEKSPNFGIIHQEIFFQNYNSGDYFTGLILGLRPAKEIQRYFVTTSLIGWAKT